MEILETSTAPYGMPHTPTPTIKVSSRNKLKPAVSEETRMIVGRNLTEETDFYLWCRQRLNTMYYALVRDGRLYLEDSVT